MSLASASPPQTLAQILFLAKQKDQAKELQKKQAVLMAQQQAKLDTGGIYFDPSHQVICHVVEMLFS